MELSDKVKAYLFWGCFWGFMASLGQVFVYVLFALESHTQVLLIPMSILNWVYFAVATHFWAKEN